MQTAPRSAGHVLDGRFVITEVLSRSGMGTIFKAEDKQEDNRLVAVKVPHLEYESDPNFYLAVPARRADRPGVEPPFHPQVHPGRG